jgi:uncharacterized protein (TIGR03437 family)
MTLRLPVFVSSRIQCSGWFSIGCLALGLLAFGAARTEAAYPGAGRDDFPSSAIVTVEFVGGPTLSLNAVGPTSIERSAPFDAGDGLDTIATEITQMNLRSDSPLGPVDIRESGMRQSIGQIQQKTAGVDFPANSFFDVFVEVLVFTPTGRLALHNEDPIRLVAMIDAIPPFQSSYMPEGTFDSVDLLDESGEKVAVITHTIHFVGQKPSFSVAPGGVSGLDPGDLFDVPRGDNRIPADTGLGLSFRGSDNVDALSYGNDFIDDFSEFKFSVDKSSQGVVGSAVRCQAEQNPPEAHGDEFWVSFANIGTNALELDEDGSAPPSCGKAPPFRLQVSDDVDAITEPPLPFVDPDGNGVPDRPVYFSLDKTSPSLSELGAFPGDVLRTIGGGPPTVYIDHAALGLVEEDDLDALCLAEGDNFSQDSNNKGHALFSLAPGSPTLTTGGFSAADLFLVANAGVGAATSPPVPFARASTFGLLPSDNLNALKCSVVEVDEFSWSDLEFTLNGTPVKLHGETKMLVAVGRNGEAPLASNPPANFARQKLAILDMIGSTEAGMSVLAVKRSPEDPPGQFSRGSVLEEENSDSSRLEVAPWGTSKAWSFLDLWLQITYNGMTLHHAEPISLHGLVTNKPPLHGEFLEQIPVSGPASKVSSQSVRGWSGEIEQAPLLAAGSKGALPAIPLRNDDGSLAGIVLSDVRLIPDGGPAPPRAFRGGNANAADFRRGTNAESINSVFGEEFSEIVEGNTEAELPTELAGTSLAVIDSAGERRQAQLFVVIPGQITFYVPPGTALGTAILEITREDGMVSRVATEIVSLSPGIFTANSSGQGVPAANVLHFMPDLTFESTLIFDPDQPVGSRTPIPIDLGGEGEQVFVSLFGTGFRKQEKGLLSGEITATVGGEVVPAVGARAPGFVGLDQINVGPLPRSLAGAGDVELFLTIDGVQSNTVMITFQ